MKIKTNKYKQAIHKTHMGAIITFNILFDFDDDKKCSSFWTNNEKAGNYGYDAIFIWEK